MYEEDSAAGFERYKERITNFSGEFELGLFLYIAKRNLLWIASFFSIALVLAFLYLRYTPPLYESSTVMQISTNNNVNKILNVGNIPEEDENIEGAIEVIRSKVFIKRGLEHLPLE